MDKGVHLFPKSVFTNSESNSIEFEIADYDASIQHVSDYASEISCKQSIKSYICIQSICIR